MTPDSATTSTPAPQAAAPGPQPAPASPAPQPTPVQLLWEVATLAFELMRRLVHVLRPIQQYYPKQALLLARLLIDIPRIFLTLRYAPERVTIAQLRHLTRARHLLQALFNYTLPSSLGTPISRLASAASASQSPSASTESLGARTPSSATATANQSPSASPENATPLGARTPSSATTPSPAVPTVPSPNSPSSTTPGVRTPSIREVPEIPMVAGVSHVPASSTVNNSQFPLDPSHSSPTSHPSQTSQSPHSAFPDPQSVNPQSAIHNPQSPFSPFVPDFHTLAQALKADSLPPNCAGALFENPADALVKALHQLHTIYFSLYTTQPPTPTPSQSPSPSQSSGNLQSAIFNLQSGTPQSDVHSVHSINPVNHVNPVNSVHSPSPSQSEIPNPDSSIPHSAFPIPHSTAPS